MWPWPCFTAVIAFCPVCQCSAYLSARCDLILISQPCLRSLHPHYGLYRVMRPVLLQLAPFGHTRSGIDGALG